MPSPIVVVILAGITSGIGVLGGLGGAMLLVPSLAVMGVPARVAAPLGLISVAAGSLAAGTVQLTERSVNHRLGVVSEITASAAAVIGALASGAVSDMWLRRVLALVAVAAALLGGARQGLRNLPDPDLDERALGETPGHLAGAYPLNGQVVPYQAVHLGSGLTLMGVAGLIAGLAGVSGGFIKTPTASEVMHVPVRVAAATTTFTIGITSATGLVVMGLQGRVAPHTAAACVVGSLVGGRVGVGLQGRLAPPSVRRALSAILLVVAVVLVVT